MLASIFHVFMGAWIVATSPVFPCAGVIFVVGTLYDFIIFEAGLTKFELVFTRCVDPSYSGSCALVIITVL